MLATFGTLLILVLLALASLFFLRLEVRVRLQKKGADDEVQIIWAIPPLWQKETLLPVVELVQKNGDLATRILSKVGETTPRSETVLTIREQYRLYNRVKALIRRLNLVSWFITPNDTKIEKKVHRVALAISILPRLNIQVKEFQLYSCIGLGDAACTAFGVGILWSLIGGIYPLIEEQLKHLHYTQKPTIYIEPLFNAWHFQGRFQCILSFSLGEIIYESVKDLICRRSLREVHQ